MINKGACERAYACNPNNWECECDKSCDVGKYLDYENCKRRKRLVDKLVEECKEYWWSKINLNSFIWT